MGRRYELIKNRLKTHPKKLNVQLNKVNLCITLWLIKIKTGELNKH